MNQKENQKGKINLSDKQMANRLLFRNVADFRNHPETERVKKLLISVIEIKTAYPKSFSAHELELHYLSHSIRNENINNEN